MLIKIGDFAKEARVTVKALRHYEQLGLLKPAWINRNNGYRYYAPEQRARLDLLRAFKDLGFTLVQVARLLDDRLTERELRMLLANRLAALQSQIRLEEARMAQVKTCLEKVEGGCGKAELERILSIQNRQEFSIQQERTMEIKFKHIAGFQVVGMRYVGKNEHDEIGMTWAAFNRRADQIKNVTGEAAYGVCGMPAGLPEGEFEYICALPVTEPQDVPEGMIARSLPDMKVAVFEHRGSAKNLGETYTNIYQKWLPEAGLTPLENGLDMEMYNDEFKNFAPDSVMYIYVPVKE